MTAHPLSTSSPATAPARSGTTVPSPSASVLIAPPNPHQFLVDGPGILYVVRAPQGTDCERKTGETVKDPTQDGHIRKGSFCP